MQINPGIFYGSLLLSALLVVVLNTVLSSTANAQTPSEDQLKKEVELLKLQKEKAELEAAVATAEANKVKALFPAPTTKPLEGKTTIDDNVKIETEMLSYRALDEVSKVIAERIKAAAPKAQVVAILSAGEKDLLIGYSAALVKIGILKKEYEKLAAKVPTPAAGPEALTLPIALQAGTSIVGAVADLLAFFRTDVDIKGHLFQMDEKAPTATVLGALRTGMPDLTLFYPKLLTPRLDPLRDSSLIKALEELDKAREETHKKFDAATPPPSAALKDELAKLDEKHKSLLSALTTVKSEGTVNALTEFLRAEALGDALQLSDPVKRLNSYWLQLAVLQSGGNNKIRRNFFDVFTGNKLTHSGGVVIEYTLLDITGAVKATGVIRDYLDYRPAKKIQ